MRADPGFRVAQRRMLLATMFCYFFYYTGRQTFGFAIPGIQQELGIDKETLGWVSAIGLWVYACGQAINGNLGDKLGGRTMMSLGAVLSCATNWVVSFGGSFLALAIPWGVNGYFQSMGWAPGSRLLSNWWENREHGRVYGLYVFAAGMSSVLAFTTSLLLVTSGFDWRWIFRLPVLCLLLAGVAYYVVVRNRPEDLGFEAIEDTATAEPVDQEEVLLEGTENSWARYREVITNSRFMIASFAIGFQSLARYGLLIWVPVYFLGENWKEESGSAWFSLALPLGMAAGALASGWLSDRVFRSRRWPVITSLLSLAALTSTAMFFTPKDHWAALPLLFCCGFFAYGPQAAFWALCPDLLGRQRAGTGTGVMDFFAYLFAGLGGPMIGYLVDTYDDPALIFPIVAVSCAASAAIGLFIRR